MYKILIKTRKNKEGVSIVVIILKTQTPFLFLISKMCVIYFGEVFPFRVFNRKQ